MSAEQLASIAALVLSLLFSYVPGLRPRYDALQPDTKRLIMLVALVIVSAASFGLACTAYAAEIGLTAITCDVAGAFRLVTTFIAALVANQATFLASPKFKRLK